MSDVSYTPVPANFKLTPENEKWDVHINAWKIAQLSWPDRGVMTQHDTDPPLASPLGARLHPDTHLLCFDFLYYMSVIRPFEWGEQYSPQWAVGTHIHFAPRMYDIANGYLRRLFGVPEGGEIPPVSLILLDQYCCFVTYAHEDASLSRCTSVAVTLKHTAQKSPWKNVKRL